MTRKPYKITEAWAYISVDADGDEGICAFKQPDGSWMPMVMADKHRLFLVQPHVQMFRDAGLTVRLVHLSGARNVGDDEEAMLIAEGAEQHRKEVRGEHE